MRLNGLLRGIGLLSVGAVAAVGLGNRRTERRNARLVDDLLADASVPATSPFDPAALDDLPAPVRRYFETVLPEGQPPVRTVRLEQRGEFQTGEGPAGWRPFTATQWFTVDPLGFVWDAEIEMAPLVSARVVDAYRRGSGFLRGVVFGFVPVVDVPSSPGMDEGELLRYLGEAVWFPTALLPSAGVEWVGIDDRSARATLEHEGTTATLTFHFDAEGLVERVHAERYRQEADDYAPWTGHFREYRERNGVCVPTEAEVEWNPSGGDEPYWRATVTAIDHRT